MTTVSTDTLQPLDQTNDLLDEPDNDEHDVGGCWRDLSEKLARRVSVQREEFLVSCNWNQILEDLLV